MSEGVAAALAQVLAESGEQAAVDLLEQAGLFADLDAAEIGSVDAPSPLSRSVDHPLADAVRRGGRPKGARNRRTEATVRWLLTQNRHPLAVMAEFYSMTPAELARRLGLQPMAVKRLVRTTDDKGVVHWDDAIDRATGQPIYDPVLDATGQPAFGNEVLLDLLKLQVRMAEAVAPYVAQRLPQAVTLEAHHDFTMRVEGVSFPARVGAAGNSEALEGVVLGVKSDGESRTED